MTFRPLHKEYIKNQKKIPFEKLKLPLGAALFFVMDYIDGTICQILVLNNSSIAKVLYSSFCTGKGLHSVERISTRFDNMTACTGRTERMESGQHCYPRK